MAWAVSATASATSSYRAAMRDHVSPSGSSGAELACRPSDGSTLGLLAP
jgi:hypothetical protein